MKEKMEDGDFSRSFKLLSFKPNRCYWGMQLAVAELRRLLVLNGLRVHRNSSVNSPLVSHC